MPDTDIAQTDISDLTSLETAFSVPGAHTDAPGGNGEFFWVNNDWTKQLGYYKKIPELQAAIDAKATWTVGKGYKAMEQTTVILDAVVGFGKDTFNTILENMIRVYHIGGDAFAEIITDEDDILINLKVLDPSTIKIVTTGQGIITRYEQISKGKTIHKWAPEKIFHLARNRVADEIHGISMMDSLKEIIDMRNEAMADMRVVFHRYVKPINIFHLDTDDTAKIAAFKSKADAAVVNGENLYIPKGAVELDRVSIPQFSSLNPMPWIENLNQYFYQATGGTDIVIGATVQITEANAKIKYLAFQQTIEEEQLYIEEQTLIQLNHEIELAFPASLENELLSDEKKDGEQNIDPNETEATPVEEPGLEGQAGLNPTGTEQ